MGDAASAIPIACWVGDDLTATLAQVCGRSEIDCLAVGGGAAARAFADELGVPSHDDIRQLAAVPEARAIVLMDPERPLEPDVLSSLIAAAAGRPVLSMTPRPGDLAAFLDERSPVPEAAPLPIPIPSFRGVRRGRRLIEAAETFGSPISASVEVTGPAPAGVVATRLLDAIDLLSIWFGLPAFVQATAVQPVGAGDTPPTRLFVIARYPDGRAASITAGADGGRHQRAVVLHGEAGRLRGLDGAIEWTDPRGEIVEFEPSPAAGGDDLGIELAESIESAVLGRLPQRSAEASLDLLAVGEACLLGARTGEPEAIERVRRMLGRV